MDELEQADPVLFRALYQQQETNYGGNWFDKAQLLYYRTLDPDLLNRYIIVDPANSKRKQSDFTVMFVFGVGEDHNYYWLHMLRDRLDPDERARALIRLHRTYKPVRVGYEEYGMQADIFYVRKMQEMLNYRFHIQPLGNVGPHRGLSKPDRIRTLIPLFRTGLWYFPQHQAYQTVTGQPQDMVPLFVEKEYLKYPRVSHDDMLDAMSRVTDSQMAIEFPIAEGVGAIEGPPLVGRTWMSG